MRYLWTVFIMCMGIWGKAQTITVTGRVMEHSSKTPVEFATVWIESVGTGAITDKDGYFRLEQIPCDESKLTVSCWDMPSKSLTSVLTKTSRSPSTSKKQPSRSMR